MNISAAKSLIHVAVQIREPLLQAGACAALQQAGDIVQVDTGGTPQPVQVLVVDGAAVPTLSQHLATGAQTYAGARVLVVVASARNHAIECAFRHGIHGVILNTASVEDFIAGVKSVARGDFFLCSELARQAHLPGRNTLTTREDDVMQLLAQGLCNKSIARQLDIAAETVKFHVKSIMVKLNASSRTEAASIAISQGLTEHFALSLPKWKAPASHSRCHA